jgi:hypothetical protein
MTAGLATSKRQSKGLTFAALVYTKQSAELRAGWHALHSSVKKGAYNFPIAVQSAKVSNFRSVCKGAVSFADCLHVA